MIGTNWLSDGVHDEKMTGDWCGYAGEGLSGGGGLRRGREQLIELGAEGAGYVW